MSQSFRLQERHRGPCGLRRGFCCSQSGSGSGGDGGGEGDRPESPPRDLARGKGPVVTEGASREVPVERPEFVPAAVSSGHQPISKSDFTEYVNDDVLAGC